MTALVLFHLRAGARVALVAATPILGLVVALAVFQDDPAVFVLSLAAGLFPASYGSPAALAVAALAFLLPAWGATRLSAGTRGWLLHLPLSAIQQRDAFSMALLAVQLPLLIALILLGAVAQTMRIPSASGAADWAVVLAAGAAASVPVARRWLAGTTALATTVLALATTEWSVTAACAGALLLATRASGPLRGRRPVAAWRTSGASLSWSIARRALGPRLLIAYVPALLVLGCGGLFLANNSLSRSATTGPLRFATTFALAGFLAATARMLATRRPPSALSRSWPWSASQRATNDAIFLGAHALPVLAFAAGLFGAAMVIAAACLPFLSLRAVAYQARLRVDGRWIFGLAAEGVCVAAVTTVVPWSAIGWLAASLPALRLAAQADRGERLSRWSDWHDAGVEDAGRAVTA